MDKIGTPTGVGKIIEDVVPPHTVKYVKGPLITAHTLYNFNVDGNVLKPEHQRYIDKKILPILRGYRVHAKLIGTTSRSGDTAYNKQLALERVLRVKRYLVSKGISEAQVPGQEIVAAGEHFSTAATTESERDRAVTIALGWGTKPKPIYPDRVQVLEELILVKELIIHPGHDRTIPRALSMLGVRTTSTRWKMKYLGEGSFRIPFTKDSGASAHTFWLVDLANKQEVLCYLPTVNVGIGTPYSFTLKGPWNHFTTPKPAKITDFSGPASFLSGPSEFLVGPFNKLLPESRLMIANLKSLPVLPVKSGFNFGANLVSQGTGYLECTKPVPYKPTPEFNIITGRWETDYP